MIREFKGEYEWLSNFSPVVIEYKGHKYPSVEHAYVAAKVDDPEWRWHCTSSHISPASIKKQGQKINIRKDWDLIKLQHMRELIDQKFDQEPYKSLLLSTGTQKIMEGNRWNDTYWGVCLKTNKGENNLGLLIAAKRLQRK